MYLSTSVSDGGEMVIPGGGATAAQTEQAGVIFLDGLHSSSLPPVFRNWRGASKGCGDYRALQCLGVSWGHVVEEPA